LELDPWQRAQSVWIDAYVYVLTIPTVMLNKIAKGNIFAKAGPPSDITKKIIANAVAYLC